MRFLSVIVFGFFIYFMYLCKSKVMFDPILNDLYFGFFTQGPILAISIVEFQPNKRLLISSCKGNKKKKVANYSFSLIYS